VAPGYQTYRGAHAGKLGGEPRNNPQVPSGTTTMSAQQQQHRHDAVDRPHCSARGLTPLPGTAARGARPALAAAPPSVPGPHWFAPSRAHLSLAWRCKWSFTRPESRADKKKTDSEDRRKIFSVPSMCHFPFSLLPVKPARKRVEATRRPLVQRVLCLIVPGKPREATSCI